MLQDDLFAATDSVTVVPLTTTLTDAPLLRVRVTSSDLTDLEHDSEVMVDKLTTVRPSNVQGRVGRLNAKHLAEVERYLTTFLGPAR